VTPDQCLARRQRLNLSTETLARRAGLAERTVIRFEAAAVSPRFLTVLALRRALDAYETDPVPSGIN
jgi:predicted transcriptional regulator